MVTPPMIMGASIQEVSEKKTYEKMKQHTIQVLTSDWEHVRREQDSDDPAIPKDTNELERLTPATETPLGFREPRRGTQKSTQTDQTIRSSAGDTGCRDKGSESRSGWKKGASD